MLTVDARPARSARTTASAVRLLSPARLALFGLLAGTAVLYLWGLGSSGWANAYYSAAAQAGASSWRACLFGATDAPGAITIDKTPASVWVMGLSVRLFGLSSWSVLVPQALEGVAAVGLLYTTVRRWAGPGAAWLAGLVLALTPVAVLLFRFDNPDSLLVLCLVAAAYCLVRALERGQGWWLAAAGALVGFGFLAKMLQAFLVVPGFALVYLVAAPIALRRRIGQLVGAGLAVLAAGGWWVALVELWPPSDRPYIGGSQHNSVLELMLGYNGFGRLTGNETGGLGNTNFDVGWTRLFGADMGGQISWLLPAALIVLVAGLWFTRHAPRTDRTRAALLLWGGWLLVTGVVFSLANGIVHPYYTIVLAPPIAALTGIGVPSAGPDGGGFRFGGRGGMGGVLDAATPGPNLTAMLRTAAGQSTWVAATVGSNNAAGYQLAADAPVLAVGGFNGTDPAPTLTQFQALVHTGQIRYFLGAATGRDTGSGSDQSRQIATWVAATYSATTVDGVTVYTLTP